MDSLLPLAEKIAARLIERKETVAVAEGSAGGLISAALLADPRRIGLFRRRRRGLHRRGAKRVHRHQPRRHEGAGHSTGERALCGAAGAAHPRTARHHLGARRGRRRGAFGQPLRRSGRPHLHRRRRTFAAHVHVADRQQRPAQPTCAPSRRARSNCSPSRSARSKRYRRHIEHDLAAGMPGHDMLERLGRIGERKHLGHHGLHRLALHQRADLVEQCGVVFHRRGLDLDVAARRRLRHRRHGNVRNHAAGFQHRETT